jgi:DNA-(apurinic or apyrimidinic site) lyase
LVKKDFNNFFEIYSFFKKFIPESKNNRRFVDTKLKRVSKLDYFYKEFLEKIEFYNNNMEILLENLSKIMNQKLDAKTIVFAIKMFSYGSRNIFGFKKISEKIHIPVDSRLEKLYYRYNHTSDKEIVTNKIIKEFYSKLSEKLSIPELHLDAILWVNYDEFIK